jgi:hypothetical protein
MSEDGRFKKTSDQLQLPEEQLKQHEALRVEIAAGLVGGGKRRQEAGSRYFCAT